MALTAVDFVDADLSTVLYALMSSDGSANSSWGSTPTKFALGGNMKLDVPHDAERFQHPGADGAFTTFSRRGLGTCSFTQVISASSEANLRLGVGRLIDLVTRGGILRITAGVTRYLRFEPSPYPTPFQGKEVELHDIYQQFAFRQGLDVVLHCQPFLEGPEQTIGPTDVPNDPASTNGRALSVSILGDLPVPVRVRARMEGVDRTLSTSAAADDIIDCTAHGFDPGHAVIFTSLTGGAGLTVGTTYWVVSTSFGTNTFRVAATPGGAALGFTTDITAGTVVDAANVQRVQIAAHTTKGLRNAAALADYQDASNYRLCQLEGNNGPWTVTLASEVTATADTQASPGTGNSMARCAHTTNPELMSQKVRATASSVEPLRGEWDVYLRCAGQAAEAFEAQLVWGPTTSTPFPFANAVVSHDPSANGTPSTFGYVELYLGAIHLPLEDTLTGLGLEVRTRNTEGNGDLDLDYLWFVSRDIQGTVVVPGGSATTVLGKDLSSAVTNPAGGTAGTDDGTALHLDTTTDNAGIPPNAGTVLAAGRYRITYRAMLRSGAGGGPHTLDLIIRNITGSADLVSQTVALTHANLPRDFVVEFDADGTTAYQEQVDNPSSTGMEVKQITREFVPALTHDQGLRSNPQAPSIERVNSSGNVTGYLGGEGGVPITLNPGTNIVAARALDVPLTLYEENESRRQRQMALTLTYFPRYGF